jgi:hypothetical protein
LACEDGEGEYREANSHCSSADTKELVKVECNDSRTITKILRESWTEFTSLLGRGFCLRQMYNDPEWLIGRKLSRPSDDEFLYIAIEIPFAEWKRIQAMKELGDFFYSNLDRVPGNRRISAAIYIRCMPHPRHDSQQDGLLHGGPGRQAVIHQNHSAAADDKQPKSGRHYGRWRSRLHQDDLTPHTLQYLHGDFSIRVRSSCAVNSTNAAHQGMGSRTDPRRLDGRQHLATDSTRERPGRATTEASRAFIGG